MNNTNNNLVKTIKLRVASREDSEFAQAILRVVMVLFMLAYFLSAYFRSRIEPEILSTIYILTDISLLICVLIIVSTGHLYLAFAFTQNHCTTS